MRAILRQFGLPPLFLALSALSLLAQGPAQKGALDRANLDTTCAPCRDFFQFANGGWLRRTTIPAAYSSFGSFRELADRNEAELHKILDVDAAAANADKGAPGEGSYKVGAFYASCMDTTTIDKIGISALRTDLDIIAGITSPDELKGRLGTLEHLDGLAPWGDGSTQDAKDANSVIASLSQGGLTLPDRDYYTKTDSVS